MIRNIVLFLFVILLTGIPSLIADEPTFSPDELYKQAEKAMEQSRYEEAYYQFLNASEGYALSGDTDMKRKSLQQAKRINWMFAEMQLNKTSADEVIAATIPVLTPNEREVFLEPGKSIQTESDGETFYFEGIARNIQYHNTTLIRESMRKSGESPFFDQMSPYIGNTENPDNPIYQNHTYTAIGVMSIPREELVENGTLQVWLPLPVATAYQNNISILSVEPSAYVVSGPQTSGNIGEVYLEIPLEEMAGEYVNISTEFTLTTSPRINRINPDDIKPYDTGSSLYQRYTQSQASINVSQEIVQLAHQIVGDETNPYKKAKLLYDYIIDSLPYSNVPHTYIAAMNISESDFVHDTGFGDCGTQSAYFAALCRAVGIPARAPGGYQLFPGYSGTHFWAEFFLPEYGWMPVDVTIAEAGTWAYNATPEQVEEYSEFFFGNMDPYRFTIQTDMDEPFSGEPNPDILFTIVHQNPSLVCVTSDEDVEMIGMASWTYTFEEQ